MTDPSAAAVQANLKRVRTRHFQSAKENGVKITGLTSYDQLTASIFDAAGIDFLLVGDSAGNNVLGYDTTLPVSVDDLIPLTRAVAGAVSRAFVVADMPFGSYETSPDEALHTAFRFMKETHAHAVEDAGAFAVVLEMVPSGVAAQVTRELRIPTIGVGAGPHVDGQLLVWTDWAGLTTGRIPKFVRQYANLSGVLTDAAKAYMADVADGAYPAPEHEYTD
jgi:3-methyl-2-oxobutanoate hydroxymethyltransferase